MPGPYYKNRWGFAQCACEHCAPHMSKDQRDQIARADYNQVHFPAAAQRWSKTPLEHFTPHGPATPPNGLPTSPVEASKQNGDR